MTSPHPSEQTRQLLRTIAVALVQRDVVDRPATPSRVIEFCGLDEYVLVGHSMGGKTAHCLPRGDRQDWPPG